MASMRYLDDDVVRFYEYGKPRTKENYVATLGWGDRVKVVGPRKVELTRRVWDENKGRYVDATTECALPAKARFRDEALLKVQIHRRRSG